MLHTEAVDLNDDQDECLMWKADLQISTYYLFLFPFTLFCFLSPNQVSVCHSTEFFLQRLGEHDVLERSTSVILSYEDINNFKKWLM